MNEQDVRRYKDEVLKNFTMAEGAFVYGNRMTATLLIRDAYKVCQTFIEPEWWSGQESVLYLHFRTNCPKMHEWWLMISGETA